MVLEKSDLQPLLEVATHNPSSHVIVIWDLSNCLIFSTVAESCNLVM